jgi:hypothetical protein
MFEMNLAQRTRSFKLLLLVFLIMASAYPNSAFGQITWTGGAGSWSNVNMWSPNPCAPNPPCYPSNQNPLPDVAIDGGNSNASSVTLDVNSIINNLTIDSDDSLGFKDGDNLWIYGTTINNAGQITVNSSNGGSGLIIAGANVTLSGGGTLTLAGGVVGTTNGSPVLTIQETIQGSGELGVTFNNQSLVDANGASPLHITPFGTDTNSGTLEASGGGLLEFDNGVTLNNAGGTIRALDGSTVQLNAQINDGTLTTTGSGVIHGVANGPILNGVTNSGTYQVPDGSTTALEGTITNTGAVQLNSTGVYGATLDLLGSGITLTGGGTVTLSDQARNSVNGTLDNQNNTISGSGSMGSTGTLTNRGVINATSANHNHLLISYSGDLVTNTGTMEASSGGTLDIGTNVTNTGGTIQALAGTGTSAGGTATLTGVTVTGGTLKTSGTGVNTGVVISTNSTFNGIANAGTLQVADNSQSFLEGTIDNIGLIQLLSTSQGSNLRIIGNVTLSGSGSLTMLNKTSVWGKTGSEILTNQSTIQGSGNLGLGFMGLVNKGAVLANQTTPLTIRPDSSGFNNMGKLSVAKGSTLDITIGPFLNFSGTTLTGGTYLVAGTLQFDNANIVTNAANITLTGSSSQIIDQSSRNALASFATNASSGSFTLSGGQVFAAGAFSNAGRTTISKGSTFTAGGSGYTQTGGTTRVDGTLATSGLTSFRSGELLLVSAGPIDIQGGSVFGTGNLSASVNSSGVITPADSGAKTGVLTITGAYTQNPAGALDINIAGTTPGKQFDRLAVTGTASLSGTLNIGLLNGFVPTVGSVFGILTASSVSGRFATVHGASINSSEHFVVKYNANNVTLHVVTGP